MRVIELDGRTWDSELDFYRALGDAVSGGQDVACNVNSILDYMVWDWEGDGWHQAALCRSRYQRYEYSN